MARTFSRAAQNYGAGTYGPFSVDNFVSADTDLLRLTLTRENWPAGAPLITGQMRWNTGDGADFSIHSPSFDRFGNPETTASVEVFVPQTPDGKAAVTGGTVTITALQALRTAITLAAEANP